MDPSLLVSHPFLLKGLKSCRPSLLPCLRLRLRHLLLVLLVIVVVFSGHHRRLVFVVSSGLRVLLRRRHLGSIPSRWFSVDHHLSQFVDR